MPDQQTSSMPHSDEFSHLEQLQEKTLGALIVAIATVCPMVVIGLYLRDGITDLLKIALVLQLAAIVMLLLHVLGMRRWLGHALIYSVLILSTAGIVVQGSLRGGSALVLLAAVVGAGIFLSKAVMFSTAAAAAMVLALLNYAEQRGWLNTPPPQADWTLWLTQVAVLTCLVIAVAYNRYRQETAYRSQHEALKHAHHIEAQLRSSENLFKVLFRNNPAACMVQSLNTLRILDANDAFVEHFGYDREELLGMQPPELWANAREHLAFRAAITALGRIEGMRGKARRKDGSEFDAVLWAELATQGQERLMIATVLDVSVEVQSRRELEKSQERFAKAFNFSPLGMTITRLSDGKFMEVNPANERVMGWPRADIADKTSLEVGMWVDEMERHNFVESLKRFGRLQGYEARMRSKQGEIVDVRLWAEIIDLDGERCALSFTMNVTEEKRREATLLRVAQGLSPTTGQAFFLSVAEHLANAVDADGVVIGEITKEHQLDALALVMDGKLQPARHWPLNHTTYNRLLATDDIQVIEMSSRQILQSTPPFDPDRVQTIAGIALRDQDGSAIGLMAATWSDRRQVSPGMQAMLSIFASRCNAELVRLRRDREIQQLNDTLEQRVQARTEQLEYLNRELDAFAYSVSHDLKSPLRSIDGFMHILQEQMAGRMTPDDEDLVHRVMNSASRMGSLIADLLALARVSQGQLQRMEVDLSDLTDGVVRQERHRDPSRDVQIKVAPGLKANCDPRMAQIVLENLIGNAWKYSRNRADARIEIGMEPQLSNPAPVFFVRDNGAGFDMARADKLFKPFNRLHSASEFEGSGIGLATVRRIIERHGGQISAEAQVGQGATFRFCFGTDQAI